MKAKLSFSIPFLLAAALAMLSGCGEIADKIKSISGLDSELPDKYLAANATTPDLDLHGLRGPVKYIAYERAEAIIAPDGTATPKGQFYQYSQLPAEGEMSYTYDVVYTPQGNLAGVIAEASDFPLVYYEEFDDSTTVLERNGFVLERDADGYIKRVGSRNNVIAYEWSPEHRVTAMGQAKITYDEHGHPLTQTGDRWSSDTSAQYSDYTDDSHGNWVRRIVVERTPYYTGTYVERRNITYYE